MKKCLGKRLLSLALALVLCLSVMLPAGAAGTSSDSKISFEKVDNDEVSAKLSRLGEIEETEERSLYSDDEVVRVSIVLEDDATLVYAEEQNIEAADIATSAAAVDYRNKLKAAQNTLASKIATQALDGQKLDVVWNLTLAANIISANVEFGQIEEIEKVPGVQEVIVETRYEPAVVSTGGDEPNMATSSAMIGSSVAYAEGYTGAGTRIAIIDTGIDDDHKSFDADAYEYALAELAEKAGLTYDEYVESLNLLTADKVNSVKNELNASIDDNKTYLTSKVPYAYNYVDGDYDINHDNDDEGEHGSHVTGIAAANRYISNGDGTYSNALDTVLTQGVAPDAQVITMKVFGKGGGAYDSDYMAAIEDAIVLGADAINLSLGSANAGMATSDKYQNVMDSLANSGVVVTMSASNSYSWGEYSYNYTGYPYSDDVNFDTIGSPSSFTNSFSIASADNTGATGAYLSVDGQAVFYTETSGYNNAPMTTIAGEQEYVLIDSIGTEEEFAAIADVLAGKIAVCSRGTTSFFEKANAAVANGAIATIIVNNTAGTISMDLTGYTGKAPCVSITQADGALLKANAEEKDGYYLGTMTVSSGVASISGLYEDVEMSDFSSWGVPGSLQLKPEITAPGGNIYSVNGAIAGGASYEVMSGTSMAAPQVAGMAALVAQYIRENNLEAKTGLTARQLAQSLLMSTAVPQLEADSGYEYYSILKQGAGLANVGAAVSAETYILMDENATTSAADGKVKAELGDDPTKTGTYSFSFTVNNLTAEEQTYDLSADLFTQDVFAWDVDEFGSIGDYLDTWTTSLNATATWKVDGKTIEPEGQKLLDMDFDGNGVVNNSDATAILEYVTGERNSLNDKENADLDEDGEITTYDAYLFLKRISEGAVTVPANGSVRVTVTLQLTDGQMDELDANYPNGAYVEGYVYVKGLTTDEGVQGATHSIPVLAFYGNWTDPSMFDKISWTDYYSGDTRWNYMGTYYSDYVAVKYPGESKEYAFGGNPFYYEEYDASRNAINSDTTLSKAVYSLIRNAGAGRLTLTNTTTGETVLDKVLGASYAAYYYVTGGAWYNTSASQSLGLNVTGKDGDVFELSLTMAPEYYLENGAVDWDALGSGATLSIPFTLDNTAPEVLDVTESLVTGALTVKASDNQYLAAVAVFGSNGNYVTDVQPQQNAAGETVEISLDVDALEKDDVYLIQVYDYAMNVTTYRLFWGVEETNEVTSVALNKTELSLMKGTTASLTAKVFPVNVSDDSVIWTSSNEDIATVNANGVVTGVDVGACEITATSVLNEDVSATCKVTVKTAAVTLYGALQDEDGQPLLFVWDMENEPAWKAYAELDNDLTSIAWDWLDEEMPLYQQNGSGYMYKVDVDTGKTLAQSSSTVAFGAPMADMEFAFWHNILTEDQLVFAVYGNYFLYSESPLANTFDYGYNWSYYFNLYTGATKFVAITWGGFVQYNSTTYYDVFMALDNAGYIWYLYVNSATGELERLGYDETNLDLSFPAYDGNQYCSMVMDENMDILYLSYFTGSTNEIYMLEYSEANEEYEATLIGNVGDAVWPTALFMAQPHEGNSAAATYSVEASSRNIFSTALTEMPSNTMAIAVEAEEIDLSNPSGTLNTAVSTGAATSVVRTGTQNGEDLVTLNVTAKNAFGRDIASTNGKLTVNYDKDVFQLESVTVHAAYGAYNDATDGEIVIAYAGTAEIPAGTSVATVVFSRKSDRASVITINHEEVNENVGSKELDYVDRQVVPSPGTAILPVVPNVPSSTTTSEPELPFTDVSENASYYDAVKYVYDYDLMNGTSDTKFSPNNTLNRAMIVTILYRLEGEPTVSYTGKFPDVAAGTWYTEGVEWAAANNIVTGYTSGTYGPTDPVTREQMAAILYRYAVYKGYDVTKAADLAGYTDGENVSEYAKTNVAWALANGILESASSAIRPRAGATRAEVAVAVAAFHEKYVK